MHNQRNSDSLIFDDIRMERKARCRDFERRLQMEAAEADIERKLNQEKSEGLIVEDAFGDQFIMEMMKLKIEKENEAKLCLSLSQNSPELRELKSKAQKADIDKFLLAQINDKKAASVKEKLDLKHFENVVKSKLAISESLESEGSEEAIAKKLQYKEDLLYQITHSAKKQNMYKESLRDKQMLELTLESIKQQHKKEEELRVNKLKKLRQDIEEIKTIKDIYDQEKKKISDDEDRRIKYYKDQQEKKEKESYEKRKDMENQKKQHQDKLYNRIVSYFGNSSEKSDREEILHYLIEEELKENNLRKEKEELAKSLRWKEQLQRSAKQQYEEKIRSIEEEKLHDLKLRKKLEEEAEKDGQLAQIALNKKRQKMLEYRNQLKEQIEEKHRQQIECWQHEKALEKLRETEESIRENLLNEKCKNILGNHTPQFAQISSK